MSFGLFQRHLNGTLPPLPHLVWYPFLMLYLHWSLANNKRIAALAQVPAIAPLPQVCDIIIFNSMATFTDPFVCVCSWLKERKRTSRRSQKRSESRLTQRRKQKFEGRWVVAVLFKKAIQFGVKQKKKCCYSLSCCLWDVGGSVLWCVCVVLFANHASTKWQATAIPSIL